MKSINVVDGIVPIADFKAHASRYIRDLSDNDEPLVITQNGKPAAVVLSPTAYQSMTDRFAKLEAVEAGLADAEAGHLVDDKAVTNWLKSWGSNEETEAPS